MLLSASGKAPKKWTSDEVVDEANKKCQSSKLKTMKLSVYYLSILQLDGIEENCSSICLNETPSPSFPLKSLQLLLTSPKDSFLFSSWLDFPFQISYSDATTFKLQMFFQWRVNKTHRASERWSARDGKDVAIHIFRNRIRFLSMVHIISHSFNICWVLFFINYECFLSCIFVIFNLKSRNSFRRTSCKHNCSYPNAYLHSLAIFS